MKNEIPFFTTIKLKGGKKAKQALESVTEMSHIHWATKKGHFEKEFIDVFSHSCPPIHRHVKLITIKAVRWSLDYRILQRMSLLCLECISGQNGSKTS